MLRSSASEERLVRVNELSTGKARKPWDCKASFIARRWIAGQLLFSLMINSKV